MDTRPQPAVLVKNITEDVKTLVQGEIAMAKAELGPAAKHAGIGGGLFGGAGYFAMNAASLLYLAGGLGLGMLLKRFTSLGYVPSITLGLVAMALLLLILAGVLALAGKKQISQVKAPERTIAEGKAAVATISKAIERGQAGVVATINDRRALRHQ